MQANLKLVVGSYFFLDHVSLVRNVPTQVDFSTLPANEVKALRDFITSGHIESDNGIPDLVEAVTLTPPTAEELTREPAKEEVPEELTEEAPVEEKATEEEAEVEKAYSEMTNKELKELLEARGIETKLTAKKDLVALLEEDDKEA